MIEVPGEDARRTRQRRRRRVSLCARRKPPTCSTSGASDRCPSRCENSS